MYYMFIYYKDIYNIYIMDFVCTIDSNLMGSLSDAIFNPIPLENSLWLPNNITPFSLDFWEHFPYMSFHEISFHIARKFISLTDIGDSDLYNIIQDTLNFPIPLIQKSNVYFLEMFHGQTLTFKDVGARFMAKTLQYILLNLNNQNHSKYHILVSTSGDTGSAVADAFENTGIDVSILYPQNMISKTQREQITKYRKNVTCYEVNGTFDDCQSLVKQILQNNNDSTVKFFPANSINILRLIPQTFYYFWAYAQLTIQNLSKKMVISIPSGNLGNLTGALLAKKLGLPIHHLIGATNLNKTFYNYIHETISDTNPIRTIRTLSNAMDVGIPNNLTRVQYLYPTKENLYSYSINDIDTLNTIKQVYDDFKYLIDPHTSVGYAALQKHMDNYDISDYTSIVIATAHPAKFNEIIQSISIPCPIPQLLQNLSTQTHIIHKMDNDYNKLRKQLLNRVKPVNITLIGMPGSGKSHSGSILAQKLGWQHVDVDVKLEQEVGLQLKDIISQYGNEEFLRLEEKTTLNVHGENIVISTGGSIIYSEQAMRHLRDISQVIWLDIPLETLKSRIPDEDLMKERGIVLLEGERLEDIYNNRKELYRNNCDVIVSNCVNLLKVLYIY